MILRCLSLKSTATKPSILPSSSSAPNLHRINPNNSSSSPHNTSNPHHNDDDNDDEDNTPSSNPESDDLSLNREYDLVVQANSYNEIRQWVLIHNPPDHPQIHQVSPPLRPNRGSVEEALGRVRPSKLTRLVSSYFDHSEHTSRFLSYLLHHSLHSARSLYKPLHDLLSVVDSPPPLTQPQCDRFFDVFVEFDSDFRRLDNPFPRPDSETFLEMRHCFSNLKKQLDRRLQRARSSSRFPHSAIKGSAVCLCSLVKSPTHVMLPSKFVKKQYRHIAQLDAAAVGAYVVNNELDTINRLVARLYYAVESDKDLIKFGLERGGRDVYPIQEVVKQLRKNHQNLISQMNDLEEHVCICLISVNRARTRLLQEMHRPEMCNS